jgi:riboflavin kinase/FMN adenylyltransferase
VRKKEPIILTIGVFDGVHRGHQALLRRTVSLARSLKAIPAALTFHDHPMHVLRGGPRIPFLLPREGSFELLRRGGLRRVTVLKFTRAFSRKDPAQFVQWLGSLGRLKGIVVGENFRFGRGARGSVKDLKRMGKAQGFQVTGLPPVRVGGKVVSSSLIRDLLQAGRVEEANRCLGRAYVIEGAVAHGRHVGHKIGFPTANLVGIQQFLPRDGVYACTVKVGIKTYRAGMNLGRRPTFREDDHHRAAEVHLLGFRGRLYGKALKVHLLRYLRPERRFSTPKLLARQIQRDLSAIRRVPLKGL